MGVASIGWGLIDFENREIDSGVRIFTPGIDKFGTGKDTHLNQKRRAARGARRRLRRKATRRAKIREILQDLGWMPSETSELKKWFESDPYELRSRALHEKVSLYEIGRIILHLNQRRGFLSLRKRENSEADKDTKGMLGEIKSLENEIEASGLETLGAYLYHLACEAAEGSEHSGQHLRLRSRHIRRSMLHQEFSLIWERQSAYHKELTDDLRYGSHGKQADPTGVTRPIPRNEGESLLEQFGIENLTFFQRRVYWPLSSIGLCELEKFQLRASVADRRYQEFRMLSELNNLKIIPKNDPLDGIRKLTAEEREAAIDYLSTTGKPTLPGLRGKIAKVSTTLTKTNFTFNLEADDRSNIAGLPTECALEKAIGKKDWMNLPDDTKNAIVEILALPQGGEREIKKISKQKVIQKTDEETRDLLERIDDLSAEQIEALLHIPLPSGYGRLSVKALKKLLPHMRKGYIFQGRAGEDEESARHLAGYPRRDELLGENRKIRTQLPPLRELTDPESTEFDENFPHINNPLVLRALNELRKVVNGIIRKYGSPSAIHLEMARDLKMSAEQREKHAAKNNKFKKERETAAKKLEENKIIANRDAILLYRLWEQQNRTCLYSGKSIGFKQLFNGEVNIDHIYPRRAQDDSFMNKVVCFRTENAAKGDQLPAEWLAHDPEKLDAILQRAIDLPLPKQERLAATEVPQEFVARDLTDTAYMTRAARHYLSLLMPNEHDVFCLKGKHTALLRKQWELNHLLRSDELELKSREDHRHHALDALILAACNRSRLQRVSKSLKFENKIKDIQREGRKYKLYRLKPTIEELDIPWDTFQADVANSLNKIFVSHRPNRKISGSLHEETNYGSTATEGVVVRRKKVADLKEGEIPMIVDNAVRQRINRYIAREKKLFREDITGKNKEDLFALFDQQSALTEEEIKAFPDSWEKKSLLKLIAKKNPLKDADLDKITHSSGIPIRKTRVKVNNKAAIPLRPQKNPKEMVKPGNTHHVAIFSLGDDQKGKAMYHFEVVTLLEATRRKKCKEVIIQKTPPKELPHAEFVMSLCSGDSILVGEEGEESLYIFTTVAATIKQMRFVNHQDARPSNSKPKLGIYERKLFTCGPGSFATNFPNARKVEVLPHGEIRRMEGQ